jgi:heme exporter protein A
MPQTTIYAAPRSAGPQTTPPAVATLELARLFGRNAALAGVSLRVEPGRTVALLGPNGAGKTTLLRILATAIRPSFGSATIDGIDVAAEPHLIRPRVAYLSHATGLYDDLTADENLRFAATMLGRPDVADAARHALDGVGLVNVARERVRGFSAGMRRRLALGRLLLSRTSLVLLDEPHAALDADGMALVDRLLGRWREAGVTVLVASHQAERVTRLADGWARLDGGLLVEVGGEGVSATLPGRSPSPARVAAATDR